MISVLNDITSFKKKIDPEKAIIFQQTNSNNNTYCKTYSKVVNQILFLIY